jgi:anti-sigma regulatory factor (Ser/Thr protein kinase)
MGEDGSVREVVRRRFRNGEPALPLRHTARDALCESARAEAGAEWIDDTLLVISELVQNVSKHTHTDGELVVSLDADTVLVEVGDGCTTGPRLEPPDANRLGGRGLHLIEAVAVQWGVRMCPDGKVVWARLPAQVDS